jgi:DNA-binding transcriptional ArsR family regulator
MPTLTRSDAVFKAIADPTRREILALLRAAPATVGEIAGRFRTSRPAISRHIRQLRRAGLVVTHKRGTNRICELHGAPLVAVREWLADYEALIAALTARSALVQ